MWFLFLETLYQLSLPTPRATSFAERLRLGLAVIHGEPKGEMEDDGRNSPPAEREVEEDEEPIPVGSEGQLGQGYLTMNLLSVVPKEKPPLNVVGDVHGKIAIIVVRREGGGVRGKEGRMERERERERETRSPSPLPLSFPSL